MSSILLNDEQIKDLCTNVNEMYNMISPYFPESIKSVNQDNIFKKVVSFGQSSYGYDITLNNLFKTPKEGVILDVKNQKLNDIYNESVHNEFYDIPAIGTVLVKSVEYFKIPRNVLAICLGKSTYARTGLIVNVTPLEPGWEGYLVIELINPTKNPIRVYVGEGIAQLLFFRQKEEPRVCYSDKKGKYQQQINVEVGKV